MFEVSVPSPRYPTSDPFYLGNALGNLVNNYQQAQQGQQRTQANDLRLQSDKMALDQAKAFASGVPMNPDGTPNYSAIMKTLAEKGDIGAISSLAPIIQHEQDIQGANAPDQFLGGGYSNGTSTSVAPPAKGPWSGNSFLSTLVGAESEGNNSAVGDSGQAKGDFQFHDATWQKYAKNVPGASQYASAADAPPEIQQAVAETAPISEWGARTKAILHAKFGAFDESQTIGQLAGEFGGGGTKVASAGASDAPAAFANPDQPSIPPVSAAAGSSIPRADASSAAGAVGGASPNPLAANNPAWAGIDAALPVSPPANPPLPSPRPGGSYGPPHAGGSPTNPIIADSSGPLGSPPQAAPASAPQAPATPNQGSVASIASSAGIPPAVAANIAKAVGVAPDAPLTPQQALRAKTIIQNYAARAGQQAGNAGQGQPSAGGPIIPQFPLPKGFTDPQQAILAIDQDIARLSRFGPAAAGKIKALEDIRGRIAAGSAPVEMHAGTTLLDPRTGQVRYQAPYANANTLALQAFLEEHPNATAEEIQQFNAAGHVRGGVTQEKADDIAQAIQSGDQPPVLTGLYGASSLVRSSLAKNGFDLSRAQLQWDAAKKQITSLNGPQQVRFVGLANSVVNTIDEVKDLAQQMQNSGVPLINKARLLAYIQAEGNSEKGQLATRYINAVNTVKEEFANLANGGYAPTDAAWKLADQQINANYGVDQLDAALSESQRLIKYRLAAMPGMSTAGPGAANRYFPGNEQAPPPPAAARGSGPRKISTKSDYDALNPGDQYEAPDGSIRAKQ